MNLTISSDRNRVREAYARSHRGDRGMWKDARERRVGKERRKERALTIVLYRPENTTCL